MRTLSFDTSGGVLHLCLLEDRQTAYEQALAPAGSERQEVASLLMQEIDRGFTKASWQKRSLDLIVVGIGPGSFTGIRVAVVTARTLADALKLPLVGVSLLETLFYPLALPRAGLVLGTTSRQYFYGGYEKLASDPAHAALPAGSGTAEHVRTQLEQFPLFADPQALPSFNAEPLPLLKNIARTQADLALDRLFLKELLPEQNDGKHELAEHFPWSSVLPLYLRNPSVTVKSTHAVANSQNER